MSTILYINRKTAGRKRHFISEDENAITMCRNAIDDYASKFHEKLEEIEMIIVCTDTPEYLFPSNAIKLTGLYGERLKKVKTAFDLNCNCTGMIQGLDLAAKYMKGSSITNALVVGCFCITYPKCGMAKVPLQAVMPNEKRLEWNPFNMDFIPGQWHKMITQILERNSLKPNDIDYYIFSQLSDAFNLKTLKMPGISEDKYYFPGKEYGYTGNTCPILCLDRMWEIYSRPGNKVMICTVGAGYSAIAQLYQF